jgi:hypothetical protein
MANINGHGTPEMTVERFLLHRGAAARALHGQHCLTRHDAHEAVWAAMIRRHMRRRIHVHWTCSIEYERCDTNALEFVFWQTVSASALVSLETQVLEHSAALGCGFAALCSSCSSWRRSSLPQKAYRTISLSGRDSTPNDVERPGRPRSESQHMRLDCEHHRVKVAGRVVCLVALSFAIFVSVGVRD